MRSWVARPAARGSERGQILVIVIVAFIGLLAFAGLALEGGTLVFNRRDAQNASDLAAVAGARMVSLHHIDGGRTGQDVFGAVRSSMTANDCAAAAPCTWTAQFVGTGLAPIGAVGNGGSIPGGALGVRIAVTRTPGAILGRMLGFTTWTVTTEATAIATKPSSVASGMVLPVAICGWTNETSNECAQAEDAPPNALEFRTGQIYDLTAGKNAPGGFGWLSWGGSLSGSICTPNNPTMTLDSPYDSPDGGGERWFSGAGGSPSVAGLSTCLHQWIVNRSTVLVPIYDVLEDGDYHITGVAAFVLVSLGPVDDTMQGYFVEYVPFSGNPTAGALPPDPGDTTIYLGLVK